MMRIIASLHSKLDKGGCLWGGREQDSLLFFLWSEKEHCVLPVGPSCSLPGSTGLSCLYVLVPPRSNLILVFIILMSIIIPL